MRQARILLCTILILGIVPALSINSISRVYAETPYSLNPVPAFTQEGRTVSLVLTVNNAFGGTPYEFRFSVTDPAGRTVQSALQNYTTSPGQNSFSILVGYPSTTFSGSNSLAGKYATWVDQILPVAMPKVATSSFVLSITDNLAYERTQTVGIQASRYNASESVSVTIRTQTTSTLVFSQTILATPSGLVLTSWKIPRNATIDNYVLTLTGTTTFKSPADVQPFSVRVATFSIASITSAKSAYQRTETMNFSFQPFYPDGTIASTGVALLTLERPDRVNSTLTATYDNSSQTFRASYRTAADNQTGTWTAILGPHAYSDAYGNISPSNTITNSPQLAPATLSVTVTANTNFAVGQQAKFNASITYPDGTAFQSGTVVVYLLFSGTPTVNNTVPVVFDTGLMIWIGTYTPRATDPGGLWSLVVRASDASIPSNNGSATRAITLENNTTSPGGSASFPLYYFGIIAALVAGLLAAILVILKRRKVTHARLKIDLEAVRSEAGQIENQDFFKSVRDQVNKDKDK